MSASTKIAQVASNRRDAVDPRHCLQSTPKNLMINGRWTAAKSGEALDAINPSTGEIIATVAAGGAADVDAAVIAARAALDRPNWSGISPHERTRYLLKIADLVERDAEELAFIESLNNGMPLMHARRSVVNVVDTFRYCAGWSTKIFGDTNPSAADLFSFTLREPIGVCGQIIPWNAPLVMAAWKIAPALACGNTTILKPAEQTPLSALRLGALILEAGLPEGVVNIVTGFGATAGAAIAEHPDIDKVAFTGSTAIGKRILSQSTGNLKRVTLELGGKSPNIIFADANLDEAIPASAAAFCYHAGQVCMAGTRIFVQEQIYDQVLDALKARLAAIKVGDPFDAETTMGPLISQTQFDRVKSYIDLGEQGGACRHSVQMASRDGGFFMAPTLFSDVRNDMRIAREEIFGPVAAVIPFKNENDAVLQGNDTSYGLAAAVWTQDIRRAHRTARALKAGTVWVNTYYAVDSAVPFGGYKQSGIGREMGSHSIEMYTQSKSIFVKL